MNALDRFWSKVDRSGGPDACWPWTGGCAKDDYGNFRVNGKNVGAHVFAFKSENELPNGLFVLHSCDNPPCCNPMHLSAGTHAQNMADMKAKDRATRGERGANAKLTADQVLEARGRYTPRHSVHGCEPMAREFGVSAQALHLAITGKQWAHLEEAVW